MRKLLFVVVSLLFIMACEDNSKNNRIVPESSGTLNNISIVIENDLWDGSIGETIRDVLAAPIYGLPQDEPMFSMNQIPPSVFSGFATKNRTVLKIEKGSDTSRVQIGNSVFAKPQKVVVISGKTNNDIIKQITDNSDKIISAFKSEELKEKQRRIKLSLHKNNNIQEKLGISLEFSSAYRIAKEEDKFFWIRKDITTGTINLLLYEIPFNNITKNDSLINQIIKVRDSVNRLKIPGPTEDAYMITEPAYAPFLSETIIDNRLSTETKGIWDVKNAFMSGPFVNYMIEDKPNNRYVVIEGFAFAPSVEKRRYMLEMEAIIKSIKIN